MRDRCQSAFCESGSQVGNLPHTSKTVKPFYDYVGIDLAFEHRVGFEPVQHASLDDWVSDVLSSDDDVGNHLAPRGRVRLGLREFLVIARKRHSNVELTGEVE